MSDREKLVSDIQAIYRARESDDLDGLMAYFDPQCSFRIVGGDRLDPLKATGSLSLRETMQGFMNTWDFTNLKIASINIDGDTAFVHRAGEIRFVPSDTRFDTEFIDKFTFHDGLIVELAEFVDTLQIAETVNGGMSQMAHPIPMDFAPARETGIEA